MKVLITFFGWLVWNIIVLRIEKDRYDDSGHPFPLAEFARKNWDNWLSSLVVAALLLILGQNALHIINIAESSSLTWNDSYYAGSGIITEVIIYGYAKYKRSKQTPNGNVPVE